MGTEGKGQGMDLKTLEKPIPLSQVAGYPWYKQSKYECVQCHCYLHPLPSLRDVGHLEGYHILAVALKG